MSTARHARRKNLKGVSLEELQEFALALDEPAFRGKQLFDWLYVKGVSSFAHMTSLSKSFREKLMQVAAIEVLRLVESRSSHADGTTKLLLELSGGGKIECVLIPSDPADEDAEEKTGARKKRSRLTLCVSTQVGCPLDCAFCATGAMGYVRNLSVGEIVDQIHQAQRHAEKRITNLVYMGMGEPLMNYENVMKSIGIVTRGMGIAPRRITVSTAGWAECIRRMADERQKVRLAVSLHSLDDRIRSMLMPINKKFNLDDLIDAVDYYYRKTKQRVTYEYILFDGLNDRDEDMLRLIKLARRVPGKINIVPFHSIHFVHPHGFAASLKPTPKERMGQFIQNLRKADITVMVRASAGEDIEAACGQLAVLAERRSTATLPTQAISEIEIA